MDEEQEAPIFRDLATFARLELISGDLEPWATLLRAIVRERGLDEEGALWLVKLYNAYDSFGSAWQVAQRWGSPHALMQAADREAVNDFACTQERRNLRGGKVLRHLASYANCLEAGTQGEWLRRPPMEFVALTDWTRQVWGVGRQTAFEWVEFLAKVADFPVTAPDAQLWESEGPRRSLQSLYGNAQPTRDELEDYAVRTRAYLAGRGVDLAWEDLETVICDFHVMRAGRYYPGRHLAALRGEIEEVPDVRDRKWLVDLFMTIIPAPWNRIKPNIDKAQMPRYRDTGSLLPLDGWA